MAEPLTLLSAALARRTESPVEISSAANPRYRQLNELFESARARKKEGLTVLEGWHLLESWLLQARPLSDAGNRCMDAPSSLAASATASVSAVAPVAPVTPVAPASAATTITSIPVRPPTAASMAAAPAMQALVLPQRTWRRVMAAQQGDQGENAGAGAGAGAAGTATATGAQAWPDTALQALCSTRWLVLEDRLFDALDVLPSPAPVLALVPTPQPALPASLGGQDVVILDRVQDPGNVGAILRTAAAAGIRWLITTPGTAACWAPKVLRAGMGGHFAMTIIESVPIDTLLARLALPLVGTIVEPGKTLPLYEADLRPALAWVFGNEGEGIDPTLQTRLTQGVTIPQSEGVESLNVAAAAAICLFEQRRQRLVAA